jgi:DNA-binding winged helix-turn-helix (wHTH) protein
MKSHGDLAAEGRYEEAYFAVLARVEQLEHLCGYRDGIPPLAGLPPQATRVLWLLALPRGDDSVVTNRRLWEALWGEQDDPPDGRDSLKVQIHRIRRWLAANLPAVSIETRWGVGYCLRSKALVRALFDHMARASSPEHSVHQDILHGPFTPQTAQHQLVDGVSG